MTAGYPLLAYGVFRKAEWRKLRFWAELLCVTVTYIIVRSRLEARCPDAAGSLGITGLPQGWGGPVRNLNVPFWGVFNNSWWPVSVVVAVVQLVRFRIHLPMEAVLALAMMATPMFGAAFLVGYVEERRAFLEVLPLGALVVFPWLVEQSGLTHPVRLRTSSDGSDDTLSRIPPRRSLRDVS